MVLFSDTIRWYPHSQATPRFYFVAVEEIRRTDFSPQINLGVEQGTRLVKLHHIYGQQLYWW